MSGHTPGPWESVEPGTIISRAISPTGTVVCRLVNYGKESEANANLIAAAPETAAERDQLKTTVAEQEIVIAVLQHAASAEMTEIKTTVTELVEVLLAIRSFQNDAGEPWYSDRRLTRRVFAVLALFTEEP